MTPCSASNETWDIQMRLGIFISCLAIVVATFVERKRRNEAIWKGVVNMSAMWLVPQCCLYGLAKSLSMVGQIEFYLQVF